MACPPQKNPVVMDLPVELRDTMLSLKCHLCKNMLSVGPVMLLEEGDTQMKCGRCRKVNKPSGSRNLEFEGTMKNFLFPCIYPDCDENISWDEVESHEKTCDKRNITCPILDCQATVRKNSFEEHMKLCHQSRSFVYQLQGMMMTWDGIKMAFVSFNHRVFVVMIRQTLNQSIVCVAAMNDFADRFQFDLLLSDASKKSNYSILMEDLAISTYDDREHCFACLNESCNRIYHPYPGGFKHNPNVKYHTIERSKMNAVFGDVEQIAFSIDIRLIRRKKLVVARLLEELNDSNDDFEKTDFERYSDVLREQMYCPVCMVYMLGNIYHCEVGHVVCDSCKKKLSHCPICRGSFGKWRNIALENFVDEVALACKYYMKGCNFTDKLTILSVHEEDCRYAYVDGSHYKRSRKVAAPGSSQ